MRVMDWPLCACDGMRAVRLGCGCTSSFGGCDAEGIGVPSGYKLMEEDPTCRLHCFVMLQSPWQ